MIKIFFKYTEIIKTIEKLICHKTEDLINRIYSEESLKLFEEFYQKKEIRSEFLIQILLFHHNENCDCSFQSQLQKIYDFRTNPLNNLLILENNQTWENEKIILFKKFKKWLHLTLFLQEEENFADPAIYSIIGQIFQKIISLFISPELAMGNEKTKMPLKPRFSPPLHTFLVKFLVFSVFLMKIY